MIEARFIKSTCHPSHITADVWTVWKGMAAEGGMCGLPSWVCREDRQNCQTECLECYQNMILHRCGREISP